MLVDTATIAGGGLVLAGIGATTGGGGIVVVAGVAGLAAVVATANTATCLISNSIAFASSLENGCRGTSSGSTKEPVSGKTGKEAAKDVPSWAKGNAPFTTENGKQFAKRLCDGKYGSGKYRTGPGSEYNKIKKWGDRGFK